LRRVVRSNEIGVVRSGIWLRCILYQRSAGRGSVLGSSQGGTGAFEAAQGVQDRALNTFPLTAEAIYRMQTPFTHFNGLQKVNQLGRPQPGGKESYTPPSAKPGGGNGGPGDFEPIEPVDPGIPDYGIE